VGGRQAQGPQTHQPLLQRSCRCSCTHCAVPPCCLTCTHCCCWLVTVEVCRY
jgi:hypothetical protein